MHEFGDSSSADILEKRGGWFIGHFIDDSEIRQSTVVEVKWGQHKKGEKNAGGFTENKTATTMSVLISGTFCLRFKDGDNVEEQVLDAPGKYAVWSPAVFHDWEAMGDCVVLTVRWPSLPKDQVAES